MSFIKKYLSINYLLHFTFFIIIAIPFFYKLGNSPLRQYDESFYAMKAYEWAEHGTYMKNYDNDTHLLNTKPYFFVWVQAVFYKLFGYNNFALRLPVALCGWLTCLLCWFYLKRVGAITASYISAIILSVSVGFIVHHMARNGDQDVPLAFFLMTNLFISYLILIEEKISLKYFIAWSLTLAAALLTKGVIGFAFLPGIFLYALIYNRLKILIKLPSFYIGIALFLTLVIAYYVHREIATPGYLMSVWNYEIGRFFEKKHAENPEFIYFFKLLFNQQFFPWILFVPIGIFYILKHTTYSKLLSIIAFAGFLFLVVISFSKVKLNWYDGPIFPVLSIFAGVGIASIYQSIIKIIPVVKPYLIGLLVISGITSYFMILKNIERELNVPVSERFQPALNYLKENYPSDKKLSIVTSANFNPQVKYLMILFNEKYGYEISVKKSTSRFYIGEKVLISEPHTLRNFNKKVDSKHLLVFDEVEYKEILN